MESRSLQLDGQTHCDLFAMSENSTVRILIITLYRIKEGQQHTAVGRERNTRYRTLIQTQLKWHDSNTNKRCCNSLKNPYCTIPHKQPLYILPPVICSPSFLTLPWIRSQRAASLFFESLTMFCTVGGTPRFQIFSPCW